MPAFLLLIGIPSIVAAVVFVLSAVFGALLCLSNQFRRVGLFVLAVPTLSSLFALVSGCAAAIVAEATEIGGVITLAVFPIGFVLGGFSGAAAGGAVLMLLSRRRRSSGRRSPASPE